MRNRGPLGTEWPLGTNFFWLVGWISEMKEGHMRQTHGKGRDQKSPMSDRETDSLGEDGMSEEDQNRRRLERAG